MGGGVDATGGIGLTTGMTSPANGTIGVGNFAQVNPHTIYFFKRTASCGEVSSVKSIREIEKLCYIIKYYGILAGAIWQAYQYYYFITIRPSRTILLN